MAMDEVITWVPVEEGLPAEQGLGERDEEDEYEFVMTTDEEKTVRFRCYREAGVWRTEDDGYDEEIGVPVIAWAKQPVGYRNVRIKAGVKRVN